MDYVFLFLFLAAFIGIPMSIYVHFMKKAENTTRVYSPEEIRERLKQGFFIFSWASELAMGSLLIFIMIIFDPDSPLILPLMMTLLITGFVLLFVALIKIGFVTCYLNSCNRELTDMEKWCLAALSTVQSRARKDAMWNSVAQRTSQVSDDMVSLLENNRTISKFMAIARVYTGKNFIKNHWPILSIILFLLVFILLKV